MISGLKQMKQMMEKDRIAITDVYALVDEICDKVYVMIQITLIIGIAVGAIGMAIVDKIAG